MAILLSLIDDRGDQTPIGVFSNWRDALAAAHFDAFDPDGNPSPFSRDLEPEFERSFTEAFEPYERARDDEGMDLRFGPVPEHTYRIQQTRVFGQV